MQREDDTDGKWFNYYRTDAEQYIGHIKQTDLLGMEFWWNSCTVTQLVTTNTVTTVDTIGAADANKLQVHIRLELQTILQIPLLVMVLLLKL